MLFHPNKGPLTEYIKKQSQLSTLNKQSNTSIYSQNPNINDFLTNLTQQHSAESQQIYGKEQSLSDTILAHVLFHKDRYQQRDT